MIFSAADCVGISQYRITVITAEFSLFSWNLCSTAAQSFVFLKTINEPEFILPPQVSHQERLHRKGEGAGP